MKFQTSIREKKRIRISQMLFSKAHDVFEHGLWAPQGVNTGPATIYTPTVCSKLLNLSELQPPLP